MNSRSQEYNTLHKWVSFNKVKLGVCDDCGKSGLRGREVHWANISGQYSRNLDDWKELCASCHMRFDDRKKPGYYFTECLNCTEIFSISPSRIGSKVFCSRICYSEARIGKAKNNRFVEVV